MADVDTSPAEAPPAEDADPRPAPGWGRLLDAGGAAAAVILVVILLDVWTDGKVISRWLLRTRQGEDGDEVPGE